MDSFSELNDEITKHLGVISRCTIQTKDYGRLLLATPPESRYPYIYPRDCSCAVQLLRRIAGSTNNYDQQDTAFTLIESIAGFMCNIVNHSEFWGQRYSIEGENKSIYIQEDNVAHGIAILCNYLLTARRLKKEIKNIDAYLQCINDALDFAITNHYQKELNLFQSTTSIHESAMEEGFTLWVNFAYLYAFSLAAEVASAFHDKKLISVRLLEFRKHFLYSVSELFMSGDRYVRRIEPNGAIDLRPDFTLLSPFYFGFLHYRKAQHHSVEFIEKQLWDPELGMMMRYLPFYNDFSTHVHAGNGPWLQYTAILAQYHYWNGDAHNGDRLLDLIKKYSNDAAEIPEHLSTCQRFEEFMKSEWDAGIDFKKEFHKPILLPDVNFDKILEEANNMRRSYTETGKKCMFRNGSAAEGGYIQFATPLMWSHVEFLRALMIKHGDWWKM